MSNPENSKAGLICPRCRSSTIEVLTNSPVEGVWTFYSCTTCLYAWRSTEPEENTDPDKYPEPFRLNRKIWRNLQSCQQFHRYAGTKTCGYTEWLPKKELITIVRSFHELSQLEIK
jgi:vanillate/4-hydroxybenzoate decarboxylase subunit D